MEELKDPRYWKFLPELSAAIDIYSGPERFLATYSAASHPALASLFCAHMCQSEVRNGGLYQFFLNPTGVLAPEAVTAFRMLGLSVPADIVEAGMRWFGKAYPRDQRIRQIHLDHVKGKTREEWDPFHALDGPFYKALRLEDGSDVFEEAADRLVSEDDRMAG